MTEVHNPSKAERPYSSYRGAVLAVDDLYELPEGTVLWKPQFAGWCLFIKDAGTWRVVDAYDRDYRGRRYTPEAVGAHSPGYVIHQPPPDLGYYEPPPPPIDLGLGAFVESVDDPSTKGSL